MKIDVVKVLEVALPLIQLLIQNRVPKKKTKLYEEIGKSSDEALDSLQELAIKIVSEPNSPTIDEDIKNFKTGVQITETMLSTFGDRVAMVKRISKLYNSDVKITPITPEQPSI